MRFRMLGPLEVQVDGGWSGITAAKWRTVLAVLLLQPGQAVSTERLITEVWPDEAPARATNLVSVYVHRLRRLIGDPEGKVLTTRAPGYQLLVDPEDIDAGQFAELAREGRQALSAGDFEQASAVLGSALGLWRGSRALADVPPSSLVSAEADRLEESRVEAVQLRIQADLGCGRHAQVVSQLHRLLADYPLREELWALLMRALYTAGRQAEALEAYAQAREVIAEELGVDPSAELQQLYQRILRAEPADPSVSSTPVPADSPFATPVPTSPVEPAQAGTRAAEPSGEPGSQPAGPGPPPLRVAQLPADITDFTGRLDQVQRLRDLLSAPDQEGSPGAVVVAAVIGAGGLGKTTLAVHAAHLLRSNYPDGQLYANLQGAAEHPAPPSDVLARFLRDLGMDPARIPADEEERAAHYRSRLTDQRVLIVLDDAKDAAHVRPLLPGSASCAVLVTTRNRMPDLAGSRFVDLDVLEQAEARNMFASIIGPERAVAEPDATDEVLAACAGLPLAIRIAGARLAARKSWTVRTIATRLSDERRRLDWLTTGDLAVRACFEVSFKSLPAQADGCGVNPAHAFRLLGLWPGASIGLSAAAVLVGQPQDAVADALEVLVDAQLLQDPEPDRYRFHDLLRAYAAERAVAEEPAQLRDEAMRRVLTWYLHTTVAMARIVSPHRDEVPLDPTGPEVQPLSFGAADEALNWAQGERGNLVAATRQAADHGLDEIAWKLPVAALSFFNRRTYRTEWVTTHQIGLDSARRCGDRAAEAWVLNGLGMVYGQLGLADAIGCFEQSLAIWNELGDVRRAGQVAINLADTYLEFGRFQDALEMNRKSRDFQRQQGNRFGEAVAINNLGEGYLQLGRTEESIDCFQQAREIFTAIGDTRGEGYALHNLGQAFLRNGQVDEALGRLAEAAQVRRSGGERMAEALTLKLLGSAQQAAGRVTECRLSWTRALGLLEALDDLAEADKVRSDIAGLDIPPGGSAAEPGP